MSYIQSSPATEAPIVAQEEKKLECVCTYQKDMGKLLLTDKHLQFRSLHHDLKIPLSSLGSLKKKGRKISIKMGNDSFSFGPFDDIRTGTVFDTLKATLESQEQSKGTAGGFDISSIKGLNDQIVTDVFETSYAELPPGTFIPPDDKDAVCVEETFPIALRPLFALLMSTSSNFLEEVHAIEGDIELVFNPWTLDESRAFHTRLFDFRKKSRLVNALVHQTQNVRLHSPTELWVETSNRMEGVPFSENFTVDTKWRITEENGKCHFRTWVRVNFIKSVSLVKGKIERNSIQGTTDYFKVFVQTLKSKCESGEQDSTGTPGLSVKPKSAEEKIGLSTIVAITLGIGCVLFFILWMWYWWSSGSWGVYVAELEARNLQLEYKIEQLTQQLKQQTRPLSMEELLLTKDQQFWRNFKESLQTLEKFADQIAQFDTEAVVENILP